ncbi:MAG: 30S ribosomal protein S7 [Chloroflexi bacterium]|nr:30S ribosomal protein S7 [Chloroflexota bacterium]
MPRRGKIERVPVAADARFGNPVIAKFINRVMLRGQKATAYKVVYGAMDIVADRAKKDPQEVFLQAMKNVTPLVEVKPRRVGGATYQVPVEVRPERGAALATRWVLAAARARGGKSAAEKLAAELMDAFQNQGAAIKKREDTHKMADANKAFVHFRW